VKLSAPIYHPDRAINAEVAADALDAERADLAAGYQPRCWRCECGAEHDRGHFLTIGTHRCLACGYVGTGGVMFGTSKDDYEAKVRERMALLRREHPGETNWIGYVTAEHEPGECVECDALRRLENEDAE
jgi:hypothetical protein